MTFVLTFLKVNVDETAMRSSTLARSRQALGRDTRITKKYFDVILERKPGRWSYRMITDMLTYKLGKLGMQKRFALFKEFYTSQKYWKCGTIGQRPK